MNSIAYIHMYMCILYIYIYNMMLYHLPSVSKCAMIIWEPKLLSQTPGRPGQFEGSSTHQSFAKNKRITLGQWSGNEPLDFWKLLWFNILVGPYFSGIYPSNYLPSQSYKTREHYAWFTFIYHNLYETMDISPNSHHVSPSFPRFCRIPGGSAPAYWCGSAVSSEPSHLEKKRGDQSHILKPHYTVFMYSHDLYILNTILY